MKLEFKDISIKLVRKKIKNLNLTILPPFGEVRISAPHNMANDFIRDFVLSKLDWIVEQQKSILGQAYCSSQYITEEIHLLWGKEIVLRVVERKGPTGGRLAHGILFLQVQPGADYKDRKKAMYKWYKGQMERALPDLIAFFEVQMNVKVKKFFIRQMKTRWGSCTPSEGSIRFNIELARRKPVFLEYIVVHEMVHLLEPSHNERFRSLMTEYMPSWEAHRAELNLHPLPYEFWE
jgi:hypothetical protein